MPSSMASPKPSPAQGGGDSAAPFFLAAPESLHPALWRASQLGGARAAVTPSGFAPLDAELPGGGWPHRVLTELLLPHAGLGEMRLLAPALARLGQGEIQGGGREAGAGGGVMLFDPPTPPSPQALAELGLSAHDWVVVQGRGLASMADVEGRWPQHAGAMSRRGGSAPRRGNPQLRERLGPGAEVLWALEQALRSGHLGAALAWLPVDCKLDVLRRLQLAAQAHEGPVFILRGLEARTRPSVAPLRLVLMPAGIDGVSVRLLKRRGPALAEPVRLSLPPVLSARQRDRARVAAVPQAGRPVPSQTSIASTTVPAAMPADNGRDDPHALRA